MGRARIGPEITKVTVRPAPDAERRLEHVARLLATRESAPVTPEATTPVAPAQTDLCGRGVTSPVRPVRAGKDG